MTELIEKMADDVLTSFKAFVSKRLESVLARLEVVEKRQPEKGDPGLNGKDGVGMKGDKGEPAVILVGEGPPLAAGKGGEVYIDTLSGDLYRCA